MRFFIIFENMKRSYFIIFYLIFLNLSFAQTKEEINNLLDEISELVYNSKEIHKSIAANQIKGFEVSAYPFLSNLFIDSTETKVHSECNNRFLNKGELAIILSEQNYNLPYFKLTQIQNCTLSSCENNPNLIEYYLDAIQRNPNEFKFRFDLWVKLKVEKNWGKKFDNEIEKCRKAKTPCY